VETDNPLRDLLEEGNGESMGDFKRVEQNYGIIRISLSRGEETSYVNETSSITGELTERFKTSGT
jgi:hypothetical protein